MVSSLVGFVYAFGFILMTPQLFINYKLKSVAHLPWRAMVYKTLSTFIDDLFAFVIKMPTMHRLSCFRDDLIFFIVLYQRYIYPVDKARVNEYGQSGELKTEVEAREKAAEKDKANGQEQKAAGSALLKDGSISGGGDGGDGGGGGGGGSEAVAAAGKRGGKSGGGETNDARHRTAKGHRRWSDDVQERCKPPPPPGKPPPFRRGKRDKAE